jgi:hypothetical protein
LGDDKLHWWSVHVQNFLTAVRRYQWQGCVADLIERFLEEMQQASPEPPVWQQRQARQALTAFGRGIDNWRFKPEPDGRVRPAFRLKTAVEAPDPSTDTPSDSGSTPVLAHQHWRDRMIPVVESFDAIMQMKGRCKDR